MKHRTVFYSINHPLPKKLDPKEELFPVTASIHPIHKDCRHEKDGECSQMWDLFIPLFNKDFINWGAVGILRERISTIGSLPYQYSWHIYTAKENRALQIFAQKISNSPEKYLLLGNTAEIMFDDIKSKKSLPCLAIIEDSELEIITSNKGKEWLKAKGWKEKETPFVSSISNSKKKKEAWNKYITAVEKVADQGSIIYIPAICHHHEAKGDPVLAGGLIWCIQKGKLRETIEHVSEAQLFLRWTISELLTLYRHLGMPSNPVDRINTALNALSGEKWDRGSIHNPTPDSFETVKKQFEFSQEITSLSDEMLHEGVKSIMVNGPSYQMPLDFLMTLMKAVSKVDITKESVKIKTNESKLPINTIKESVDFEVKKSFLEALLNFVRDVPYIGEGAKHPKQTWHINISKDENVFCLKMLAKSKSESLNMAMLDENANEGKLKGSSGLWKKLRDSAPVVKEAKIKSSQSKIGLSIGNGGELVLFWKGTITSSSKR